MPLWRLRAHMAFLVNNLQYYLQVDVLEAQWQAFMTVAETCADFEELTAAHEACLAALHAQCFLQARAQRPQSSRVHHGWCGTGLGGGWSVVGRGCALGDESRPPLLELPVLPSRAGFICLDRPPPDFPAVPLPLPHALIRREGRTGRDHLPGAVCHRLARVQQAVSLPLRLPIQHVLAAAVAALCVPPQRSSLAPNIPLPCAHALVPAGSVRQHTRWSLPGPYASTRALARSYGKRVNAPHTLCICMLSRRRASHPCSHIRSSSARSLPSWQWPSCYSASTTTPFSARARGPRLERHRGQHEQPQCRTQPTTVSRGLTLREPPRRHFLCKA